MKKYMSGAEIRQSFIDFFTEQKHTYVPSASLVPGGDATLLFTNAGMVQFKDVFLGTDKRPYTRAVDSQKCMRVAGKHNDLDDVGRDDYHHTFFEMLGNWSFGDYYKKEAITWAWQLLTDVWGLPKDKIYATCFKDEKGSIPTDNEAAKYWKQQPGFDSSHVLFFGRKDNFWEMAEAGPCGPCSEVHLDRGEEFDNLKGKPHRCGVNGECQRFLELWNLVFIQYNRTGPDSLNPLPATHVDTGMGFERIVAVLQGVDSNYKIDLFRGITDSIRELTNATDEEMHLNFTPYRVIADHARAAAFLIADGVVPGNIGRNYICRMIIRRAARFGTKIGIKEPFLARTAEAVISSYGDFYPELVNHRDAIMDLITREEERFARTVESGTAYLLSLLEEVKKSKKNILDGRKAFELYATYGLPFEIARDIAREEGQDIDEVGFKASMDEHRSVSGGGKAIGKMEGKDAEFFARVISELIAAGTLGKDGVEHNPYDWEKIEGSVLALTMDGQLFPRAGAGDKIEVLLSKTGFYVESGGQVSDIGIIRSTKNGPDNKPDWEIEVLELRKPSPGAIIHVGEVLFGQPKVGDTAIAMIDAPRRRDIMRNHTATHLLHAALQQTLGKGARQAGSLVSPEHLRFDFTQPDALTDGQIKQVEKMVNDAIAADLQVTPRYKKRDEAISEGAMALFGEKYGDTVRTVAIDASEPISENEYQSYELCGGTHLERTSEAGIFLILSESSAAAGIRRIEAVTGRAAYQLIVDRFGILKQSADLLKCPIDDVQQRVGAMQDEISTLRKEISILRADMAMKVFSEHLTSAEIVKGVNLLTLEVPGADRDTLTRLADRFREKFPENGIFVAGTTIGDQVIIMSAVTKDMIKKGIKAGNLVEFISQQLGGSGGGAPHLAFGGGKYPNQLPVALVSVRDWLNANIKK